MKRIITILLVTLTFFSVVNQNLVLANEKSVEKLNNVGQVDNSNESYKIVYEEVDSRVFYGENGIDIINEKGIKHFDTKFEVLKLAVIEDINSDGYPDFLTYQNSPENTDQIFVISGQDGSIISSFRLTYQGYSDDGPVEKNSYVYKFISDGKRNFILYDYTLAEYDLNTAELLHSYQNEDNIWDVEFYDGKIAFVDQLGQLGFLNYEDLSLISKKVVSNKYDLTLRWNESVKFSTQMNLWDMEVVDNQLYFISEDGILYHYISEEEGYETNSIAVIDEETFKNSFSEIYSGNKVTTTVINSGYKSYKIVDKKDHYLLISCYFFDNETLANYNQYEFQCFILYDLSSNSIVYKYDYQSVTNRAYGVLSQIVSGDSTIDTVTIAYASDDKEKITVYDYQGQTLIQKELTLSVGTAESKFNFAYQQDGTYLLEGFKGGACSLSNDLNKVSYLFDKQTAELISTSSDSIVISYKVNGQIRKLISYQADGKTVNWSYKASSGHGIENLSVVDYNLDGINDYVAIINNYNSKDVAVDSNVVIINGSDGSLLADNKIFLYDFYDEYGRHSYVYALLDKISFVSDLDGDGKREMLISDGVVSSKNFNLKGSMSSYVETKGNIYEIGDVNGDGFTDYLTISDSLVELFTSRISYTYNVQYKRYDYLSLDSQYKNGTYGTLFEDINGDGVKEFVLNSKNDKGYQVFKVYNGKNLAYWYDLCPEGVSDYETFKVLDFDLNNDGYKEIFHYSSSNGMYSIIDGDSGQTKKEFDFWSSEDSGDEIIYSSDYYHPDYYIEFMIEGGDYSRIFQFKDMNEDGYNDLGVFKYYYDYQTWTRTDAIFVYDALTYEYIDQVLVNVGSDDSNSQAITVANTDRYLAFKGSSSFQLYDMQQKMTIAEYSILGNSYRLLNDETLLISDESKNIYLLDIQKSFNLTREIPSESDEYTLNLSWESQQPYSTMNVYDNNKLVSSTTGNECQIKLTTGEHVITLALDDGQGKKAKESYKIVISQQKNTSYYLLPIAAVVFVIAILSNMGRKFYITKKGKAGLSK